ncbi:fimbria/pilus outer membrane usher protein [Salmonella enterica subsp. enterica]|nr:fimbria/pilus outer membrane usher protein [Salmonella enterica subsp. enterica]
MLRQFLTIASVVSDDQMLLPKLRGYAPEIVGIARASKRKSQKPPAGRVLRRNAGARRTNVFRILNQSVSGTLHARSSRNGQTQEFDVNTASVPLPDARPGMVRYKMALGRPAGLGSSPHYRTFASAEAFRGHQRLVAIWRRNWKSNHQAVARWEAVSDLARGGRGGGRHITHLIAHMPQRRRV